MTAVPKPLSLVDQYAGTTDSNQHPGIKYFARQGMQP